MKGLRKNGYARSSSELDQHIAELETSFKEHPPRTVAEARQVIQEQTGLERSPTQIRAFLKRLGMKYHFQDVSLTIVKTSFTFAYLTFLVNFVIIFDNDINFDDDFQDHATQKLCYR